MDDDRELGRFLRSRRERAVPERCDIPAGQGRRVTGLRREEVARLAGISLEYYVRLEQGRARRPSGAVLAAIARTLGLDEVELDHLRDLAQASFAEPTPRAQRARAELVELLAMMDRVPAMVVDHRMAVLAWNRLSRRLFFDFPAVPPRRRNLARFVFLDPDARDVFTDWTGSARAIVGQLRLSAGRHRSDPGLANLLGELTLASEEFQALWAARDVRERTHGRKRFRHPVVGELTLRYENFVLPDRTRQRLMAFTPEPGSPSESALTLLGMWAGES